MDFSKHEIFGLYSFIREAEMAEINLKKEVIATMLQSIDEELAKIGLMGTPILHIEVKSKVAFIQTLRNEHYSVCCEASTYSLESSKALNKVLEQNFEAQNLRFRVIQCKLIWRQIGSELSPAWQVRFRFKSEKDRLLWLRGIRCRDASTSRLKPSSDGIPVVSAITEEEEETDNAINQTKPIKLRVVGNVQPQATGTENNVTFRDSNGGGGESIVPMDMQETTLPTRAIGTGLFNKDIKTLAHELMFVERIQVTMDTGADTIIATYSYGETIKFSPAMRAWANKHTRMNGPIKYKLILVAPSTVVNCFLVGMSMQKKKEYKQAELQMIQHHTVSPEQVTWELELDIATVNDARVPTWVELTDELKDGTWAPTIVIMTRVPIQNSYDNSGVSIQFIVEAQLGGSTKFVALPQNLDYGKEDPPEESYGSHNNRVSLQAILRLPRGTILQPCLDGDLIIEPTVGPTTVLDRKNAMQNGRTFNDYKEMTKLDCTVVTNFMYHEFPKAEKEWPENKFFTIAQDYRGDGQLDETFGWLANQFNSPRREISYYVNGSSTYAIEPVSSGMLVPIDHFRAEDMESPANPDVLNYPVDWKKNPYSDLYEGAEGIYYHSQMMQEWASAQFLGRRRIEEYIDIVYWETSDGTKLQMPSSMYASEDKYTAEYLAEYIVGIMPNTPIATYMVPLIDGNSSNVYVKEFKYMPSAKDLGYYIPAIWNTRRDGVIDGEVTYGFCKNADFSLQEGGPEDQKFTEIGTVKKAIVLLMALPTGMTYVTIYEMRLRTKSIEDRRVLRAASSLSGTMVYPQKSGGDWNYAVTLNFNQTLYIQSPFPRLVDTPLLLSKRMAAPAEDMLGPTAATLRFMMITPPSLSTNLASTGWPTTFDDPTFLEAWRDYITRSYGDEPGYYYFSMYNSSGSNALAHVIYNSYDEYFMVNLIDSKSIEKYKALPVLPIQEMYIGQIVKREFNTGTARTNISAWSDRVFQEGDTEYVFNRERLDVPERMYYNTQASKRKLRRRIQGKVQAQAGMLAGIVGGALGGIGQALQAKQQHAMDLERDRKQMENQMELLRQQNEHADAMQKEALQSQMDLLTTQLAANAQEAEANRQQTEQLQLEKQKHEKDMQGTNLGATASENLLGREQQSKESALGREQQHEMEDHKLANKLYMAGISNQVYQRGQGTFGDLGSLSARPGLGLSPDSANNINSSTAEQTQQPTSLNSVGAEVQSAASDEHESGNPHLFAGEVANPPLKFNSKGTQTDIGILPKSSSSMGKFSTNSSTQTDSFKKFDPSFKFNPKTPSASLQPFIKSSQKLMPMMGSISGRSVGVRPKI